MIERRAIAVRGTVQGVGFRPFVFGLATRLGLGGFVTNRGGAVAIEVEGEGGQLEQFTRALTTQIPPLATIDTLTCEPIPVRGERDFRIAESVADAASPIVISPDVATCDECLAELFDAHDRRFGYPFLNCTNCGPRLTIITGAPYDRTRTTMAAFPMCHACRVEYDDPGNRRFHAQPTACAICGPRLAAADAEGRPVEVSDPLAWFVAHLRAGGIGAMKGLGGYHLVCDAANHAAIRVLRRRKERDEKPLAVMVADRQAAQALCEISAAEGELLTTPRRPIVLLRKKEGADAGNLLAPGNPSLGVMLPYTPLHHLLLRQFGGPLVMTSGNRADEPIAIAEPDVFERLAGIADGYLTHNRPIHVRCDDSVTCVIAGQESPIRRSRGYAPQPLHLPLACAVPILAVGAQMKGAFALGRDRQAIISHHLGDLDAFAAFRAFERDIALYEDLFAIQPQVIAHDLHPDYAATRYARQRAAAAGLRLVPVQHHHAHLAACMAEHGLAGPVIGVCFDGTGYGTDGAIWGGEILVGDYASFHRAAHLRYVPLPGGERAVKEPWRMALSHLMDAGIAPPAAWLGRMESSAQRTVARMIETRFNAPPTSSVGRLFDAVASLIGVRDRVRFEGQAAMELQWLAETAPTDEAYPVEIMEGAESAGAQWDARPMIRAIVRNLHDGIAPALIARRFHNTLVRWIVLSCTNLNAAIQQLPVVLSGGVMMNALLISETRSQLEKSGILVWTHGLLPPNDGNVSFGQLSIAARLIGES